ncbi:MAG: hypothetical protein EOM22_00310 [Gammaproteobacteria bacterium]|nr:hypothetical protein [Gammaproteobacteria bacterium]
MIDKLKRILLIFATSAGLLWLGVLFGPRHLEADVFLHGLRGEAALSGAGHSVGRRVELLLNGHSVQAEYRSLSGSPRQVVTALKARDPVAPPKDGAHLASALPIEMHAMGWSLYGRMAATALQGQDGNLVLPNAGWLALALENGSGTDLWRMVFPDGLGLFDLLTDGGGDVSGFDIADLPRPPGARRVLSLLMRDGTSDVDLVVYRRPAALGDRVSHYERELPLAGYRPLGHAGTSRQLLYFGRGDSEVTVFLTPAASDGMTTDVIQHRRMAAG